METRIINQLNQINLRLYQTLASEFSATRERLQPGVLQILKDIPPSAKILDLGCGNGELALHLLESDHHGAYLGLDYSTPLLDIARSRCLHDANTPSKNGGFQFLLANLAEQNWVASVRASMKRSNISTWDAIFAFAVLHHIPGDDMRQSLLTQIRSLLAPGGKFIHSVWQFMNSPRLRKRILPWSEAGIDPEAVDENDYLLDWRRGGYAQRYVHLFTQGELAELSRRTGFEIIDSFYSDGESGNLGLYQVWSAVDTKPEF